MLICGLFIFSLYIGIIYNSKSKMFRIVLNRNMNIMSYCNDTKAQLWMKTSFNPQYEHKVYMLNADMLLNLYLQFILKIQINVTSR